jgi:hypothetical protein
MLVIAMAGLATVACSSDDEADSEPTDSSAVTETTSEAEPESAAAESDPTAIPIFTSELSDDSNRGIHMRSSDKLENAPDHVEAARRADLIVIAVVDEPGEPFWTTVSGERPGVTVEGRMPLVPLDQLRWGSSPQIFTPWTMSVVQTLAGETSEGDSILVNWWGGEIAPDKFVLEGEMIFIAGEQIILYFKDCGPDHLEKFGSSYRFIKRLVLTPQGFVYLLFEGEETPLRDLRIVIDKESGQPPITETYCG